MKFAIYISPQEHAKIPNQKKKKNTFFFFGLRNNLSSVLN